MNMSRNFFGSEAALVTLKLIIVLIVSAADTAFRVGSIVLLLILLFSRMVVNRSQETL